MARDLARFRAPNEPRVHCSYIVLVGAQIDLNEVTTGFGC
jgi:hypothetical protein